MRDLGETMTPDGMIAIPLDTAAIKEPLKVFNLHQA